MRKLKVISDGTIKGTQVCDAETGELIAGVARVEIDINANSPSRSVTATLTIHGVSLEIGDITNITIKQGE